MLDRIIIDGYKSIKRLDLTLRPINILIGSNGVGKTNFISFFRLVNNIYEQRLQNYTMQNRAESLLHYGLKHTKQIEGLLQFSANAYSFTLQPRDNGSMFLAEEKSHYRQYANVFQNREESIIKHSPKTRDQWLRAYLQSYKIYHFHDTSANSPFTQTSNVENDKYVLYSKGQNLAAFLYNIHEEAPLSYNLIVGTVQSIAPYFGDFYLHPTPAGQIRLQWTSRYSETIYGPTDLSDGTIRFIALATLFLQPSLPATIIIDEPELGLHPAAITKLAGIMKSASGKDCQIIAATQSADLLSHFLPNDIVAVDLVDGASRFQRLNNEALSIWLDNYYRNNAH